MIHRPTLLTACLALACAGTAWGGAGVNEPHEHVDEGPSYFGFVRDARGTPVADAKVSLKLASGLSYVTRSDRRGLYRVSGLGKEIKPAEVTVSCAKEGYRLLRTVRVPPPRGKTPKALEVQCYMQRE